MSVTPSSATSTSSTEIRFIHGSSADIAQTEGVLVRIVAPHFVAGVDAEDGRVVRAAPILRYMLDWDGVRVAGYCAQKGWAWTAHPYDDRPIGTYGP